MKENLREVLMGGQTFSWSEEDDGLFCAVLNDRVYRIRSLEDAASDPLKGGEIGALHFFCGHGGNVLSVVGLGKSNL